MQKQFFIFLVALFLGWQIKAQVYPYNEDFQAVTPATCFGNCSGSQSYLTGQGWSGDIGLANQWLVNDNFGISGNTKGLGIGLFSLGTVDTKQITTPLIGAITSSSVLKFKYRIVTANPSFGSAYTLQAGEYIQILASNDNFATSTTLYTIDHLNHTASNSFTNLTTGLSVFAGQNIKIRFVYKRNDTNNDPNWTVNIDQIEAVDAGPDAGATALQIPASSCGLTNSEHVQFKVKNYGGTTINNVPVQVTVNSTNYPYTVTVAGGIAPGAESPLQTVNVDLSTPNTTYTISVTTNLTGDSDASNNTTPSQNVTHYAAQNIPYATSFESSDPTLPRWQVIDGAETLTGTSRKWITTTTLASQGTQSYLYASSSQTMVADDWLISPCLNLLAGETYEVRYKVAIKSAGAAQYHVKLGNDDTPAAFTTTLYTRSTATPTDANNNPTFVYEFHNFTVPTNGIYYLAWHATSGVPIFSDEIYIDEVLIKKKENTDVEILSFDTPTQSTTNCYTNSEAVKVTIRNAGNNPLSNVSVSVNVTGAVTQNLNTTVSSLAVNAVQQVTVGNLDMTTAGTYTFAPQVSVTGDQDASNNTLSSINRISGVTGMPVTSVDFTGYTGTTTSLGTLFTGWYEKRNDPNYPTPGDATGSYWSNTSRFGGNTNAFINLFTNTSPPPPFHKNDMIVSPLLLLGSSASVSFKVAVTDYLSTAADNMGSDDFFQVVVITNCGATITPVYTISIANSNVPDNTINDNIRTVSLAAYAGQIVQIGFQASTGTIADPQDYDFHLDDINISGVEIGGFIVNLGPDQNVCNTAFPITLDCGVTGATNYAWKRNGNPIGGNTQTLIVTQDGTYRVDVTKNSVTKFDEVQITIKPDATADFTFTVNNLQVTFTNTSANASSYTWDFGDGNTSTNTSPTHTYANAGTYTVTLNAVSSQGCANGSVQKSVTVTAPVTPPTAINQDFNRIASIYPNPNKGEFNLVFVQKPQENATLFIYEPMGKLVWKQELSEKENLIRLPALPSGIYAVRIQNKQGSFFGKIQVSK